jgi:O-antigen/teichoic acid export membrane protein
MLTWVLGAFHGAAAVGFLGLGSRLIRIPMQLIGRSVGDVFLQEGARAHESGRLGEVTQSVFRAAVCLGCVPSLLVLAAGEELVVVVFGEPWREAGVYVQILAPVVFFRFLSSPISQVFSITGKQRTHMRMNFVHLVITAGLVGGACLSANARTVVASYAVASTLKYCWFSWVLLGAAGASRKQALVDLGAAAGMGLPGLVLVLGLKLAADLPAAAIAGAALAAGALTAPVVLAAARGSRLRAGGADTAA